MGYEGYSLQCLKNLLKISHELHTILRVLQRDISDISQALENSINKIGQGFFSCIWIKDGKVTLPS